VEQAWLSALCLSGALCACAASSRPVQDPATAGAGQEGPSAAHPDVAAAKPRPKPPSPQSVSVEEPGGDAANPEEAALFRQLDEAWGLRGDKDDQLLLPLPDPDHWKRVRYWGVEHFVGFRYGNEHRVLAIGFVQEVPAGTPVTSDVCMRRFEQWGLPQTKPFDVKFGPFGVHHQRWRDRRRLFDLRRRRAVARAPGLSEASARPLGERSLHAGRPENQRARQPQVTRPQTSPR